jgi:hypothetical protein
MALHDLDDRQLEAALRDAGRALAGAQRDLSVDVVAGLRAGDRVAGRGVPRGLARGRGVPRRLVPALIALAVLLTGAAVAVSGIVPGIGLRRGDTTMPARPLVVDPEFLGTPTTLDRARARVDFAVHVPALPELGQPQIYYADEPPGGRVSLLYPASDRLPAIGDTPVGLFVTQFRGAVDDQLLTKIVAEGAQVTQVDIAGIPGWWIADAHEVLYVDAEGHMAPERSRFADRTLLWTRDGVTLRLESALSRQQAIVIAATMR